MNEGLLFDYAISVNQNINISGITLLSLWDISGTPSTYNVQWPQDRILPMRENTTVIIYSKSGRGKVHLKDGTIIDVCNQCAVFIDPNDIVNYYCCDDHWKLNWMEVILGGSLNVRTNIIVPLDDKNIKSEMAEAIQQLASNKIVFKQYGLAIINKIIYQIASCSENVLAQDIDERVVQAMALVNMNIEKKWLIEDLADAVNCAPSTLRKVFKNSIGKSPKRYILDTKLDYCFTLFQQGNFVVSKVAKELNFYDAPHFENEFKRRFGVKPKEFIR